MLQLLFYTFVVAVILQYLYYLFLFSRFAFAKATIKVKNEQPVSIIIASRNESENLKKFIPKILAQNYSNFEVIVVNDASTDCTLEVLSFFDSKKLRIISIPINDTYTGNKKNAIARGIRTATHNHLLFTDADCFPKSENWISEMISLLISKKKMVLGYGAYEKLPSLINKLIRYETLITAIQYFSYARVGIPYMGVGRNLAYKKELFSLTNGFNSHSTLKSGDDDLFVNQIATKNNVEICFSKNSFTISKPKKTFTAWFRQKRRHISTASYYKPIHQFLLGLFYFSQLSFWILAILLLAFSFNWMFVTILIMFRLIFQYIILYNSAYKLNEKDLIILTPVLDFLLVLTQLGLFISNLFSKPKHW